MTDQRRTSLLAEVRSAKGIPSQKINVDPIQMLADFSVGTDPEELAGGIKVAVERGLMEQVKEFSKIGVPINSGLLMVAWAHSKSTKDKGMFNLLVSLGAKATDLEFRPMGKEFKDDYEAALERAEHSPASPTSRRKLDT